MAATDSVLSDLTEGIYTITLNRPDKLNCINLKMLDLLAQCLLEAETRDDINIVVFRGAGERAFSTGGDLTVFNGLDHNETARWIKKGHELFNRLERLEKPSIAVIQGYAYGGGLELALACDFRLATKAALFRLPEVLHGWPPGWGALQRLKRLIGEARAKEMILLTKIVNAETALAFGLVTDVVDAQTLESTLESLLQTLISIDADVYGLAKSAMRPDSSASAFDALAALYGKLAASKK